jgi:pimeloyl-ACP methyl ester carboxylesterase
MYTAFGLVILSYYLEGNMNINVNGVNIFYKKSGQGQPLILLHGNGLDHSIFNELSAKLCKHYTVYAIDSRNHGRSDKAEDYSYDAMAEDVYALIQKLELGKVYLLGFSDGAVIALHVALRHLDVLEKVAFLGLNLKPSDLNEKNLNYYQKNYEKTGDPLFKLVLESPHIELDELKSITVPTLLIAAEKEMFRDGLFDELMMGFPNVSGKVMLGHKHETYLVHQDFLYPDLLDFFGKPSTQYASDV